MSSLPDSNLDPLPPANDPAVEREPFWSRHRVLLILTGIMLVSAYFRFFGRDFDQGHGQQPDERAVVYRTMTIHWPQSLGELLDVRHSPLNLRSATVQGDCPPDGCTYTWGSLPNYLTRGTAWLLDTILPPTDTRPKGYYLNDGQATTLLGRNMASIFDLITVLLVFLITRRLYSSSTALLATALVGFAVTHIQLAHFYASDTFLTTFMMGTLYFSIIMMQRPSWWAAASAGACLGLAVASKASVVPFALVIVAAVLLRSLYRRRTRQLGAALGDPIGVRPASQEERSRSFSGHFFPALRYVGIAAFFSILAFGLSEPYVLWSFDFSRLPGGLQAFLQSNPWWTGISGQAAVQAGTDDGAPFTRQYVGTVPLVYQLQNMVLWGLSPIPGLVAVTGFVLGIWLAVKKRAAELLLMAGAMPYFATILTLEAKWMRYMLPLVPIFCLLGAALLVRGTQWARGRFGEVSQAGRRASRAYALQRNLFPILTAASVGTAFLWAVAFMNIYTQPHSRVQASDWIFSNVPPGSKRSAEGWDDALPLSLPPASRGGQQRDGSIYGDWVAYNLYDDHPPEAEFDYIRDQMAQTDYIFLASNRLYGSIPRLPWRYPVQIKFYELLFAGKLGFQNVHTQVVTPEIFGIRFDDQAADESFTVYDHPRVDIFKKVSNLTDDELRTLFSTALNRPAGSVNAVRHGTVPDDKSLAYTGRLSDLPDVGDFAWNPLAQENTQWIGVLLWLIAAEGLGLLALPVVFAVCKNLPDRGYPLAKVVGLLLVSWGVWLAASAHLVPFTVWSVLLFTALLACLSLLCWRLGAGREIRSFVTGKRQLVFYYEAIFLVAFAVFLYIRILNPDLWHPTLGGEKPMEFGFLNSILRSPWMPPADPFFAGGYINYYYQGQFIIACLIKLIGVDPAIGFNLAIPLLYGLSFSGAASLVYNLVAWSRRRRGNPSAVSRTGLAFGLLSGVLMLVIGNMHALYQEIVIRFPALGQTLTEMSRSLIGPMHTEASGPYVEQAFTTPYTSFNFWDASRIVAHTINEFPFWSFLFADLHPHLIDIAFTLLAAGLCLNLLLQRPFSRSEGLSLAVLSSPTLFRRVWLRAGASLAWLWGGGWSGALSFGLMSVALGSLATINSWDFPIYIALAGGAVLLALLRSRPYGVVEQAEEPDAVRSGGPLRASELATLYVAGIASVVALAGTALLAYLPFFLSFKAFFTQIIPLIDGSVLPDSSIRHRTSLAEFLVIWAFFVFIAASYLILRLRNFPWSAAMEEIGNLWPSAGRAGATPAAQQAFSLRPSRLPGRSGSLALSPVIASASLTSGVRLPTSARFSTGLGESSERVTEGVTDPGSYAQPDQHDGLEGSLPGDGDAEAARRRVRPSRLLPRSGIAHVPQGDVLGETGPVQLEPSPAIGLVPEHWLTEAHSKASGQVGTSEPALHPGLVPLWVGLLLLALTAGVVLLQLVTGQYLLAVLTALIGGIVATSLSMTRSPAALFTGLLLVAALSVASGVELVYLADHLAGGVTFRMNTVFKFYEQVWVLFAAGGAAAVYYILHGLKETRSELESAPTRDAEQAYNGDPTNVPELAWNRNGANGDTSAIAMSEPSAEQSSLAPHTVHAPTANWLAWSADDLAQDGADGVKANAVDVQYDRYEPAPARTENGAGTTEGLGTAQVHPAASLPTPPQQHETIRWTPGRMAWSAIFALFMLVSIIFTFEGTADRVAKRFEVAPPVGTLNGLAYMTRGTYGTTINNRPITVNLNYEYEAIKWMNQHVTGLKTIAEAPNEYYREGGMLVAASTGQPMVVGGLHQDEQRYGWVVGDRHSDMDEFFRTTDALRALTLMSKYDVDYVYLGQIEQARAGEAGMAKFAQLADPKIGVLKEVFRSQAPQGVNGAIVYQVVKDTHSSIGAPVAGSGLPGISITPVPTSTPLPPPTPPVDDPELKALIAGVAADPNDRDARLKLADWYTQHSFFIDAAQQLEIIAKQDPTNVAVRHMLGDAYQNAGQPDKALKAWEDGRDVDVNNPAGHNKVGIAYQERKRYDDAVREFQAAVAIAPEFSEAWFHLGETYEAMSDLDNARKAYQSAIDDAKGPNNWVDLARERLANLK